MLRPRRTRESAVGDHPTKRRLIEEAARRIQEGGIESVDVDELLAHVGVTKGSLYHHFASVNDLFIAGLLHAFEQAVRESEAWALSLRDDCRSALEARDRLHQIVDESQPRERSTIRSVRLHALSLARTQPAMAQRIAELQAGVTETITGVYREFQLRGWARAEFDPHALAVLIQAMNLGRIVDDVVDEVDHVDPSSWITVYNAVLDNFFILD